jgi:hypothetical protein
MRLPGSDIDQLAGIHASKLRGMANFKGMEYFEGARGRFYLVGFERRDGNRSEAWYRVQIPLIARDQETVEVVVTGWRAVGEPVGDFELPLKELRCPLTLDPVAVSQAIGIALRDLNREA